MKTPIENAYCFRATSWQHLSAIPSHPLVKELTRSVEWKMVNSRMPRNPRWAN